jgi:hypothetical protein
MRMIIPILFISFLLACSNPVSNKKDTASAKVITPADQISPDSLKSEISEEIDTYIKGGFYDKEETFQNIQEVFGYQTLDTNWIKEEIDSQYSRRLAEQKSWEKETDFDRLAQVFDSSILRE